MDRISLRGMSFFARHGVSEAEREVGQRFEVDVDMFADIRKVGDDLKKTIDYQDVYKQVAVVVCDNSYHLIEALAEHLADAILSNQLVEEVTVRVRKIHPPIEGQVGAAEVEITRGG